MAFFNECDEILNSVIGENMLRNQNLCKLLYYYPDCDNKFQFDPIAQPDIRDTSILLMENIFPLPKNPDAETKKQAFVNVTLTGGDRMYENTGFRNLFLVFDIICHLDEWIIKDSYRVYRIAEEIDSMINNVKTDWPIYNRPQYRSMEQRDYSNYFYGIQLIYNLQINSNVVC